MVRRMLWVVCFLFCFLSTSLINLCATVGLDLDTVPLWFKKGVYVEFRSEKDAYILLEFINGSIITCENLGLGFGKRKTLFIFRWECLNLNNSMAELKIIVEVILVGDNKSFQLSTRVFVDVNSRDVYSLDGELCGKTMLWLPTNLEVGDKVIFGYHECYVEGTVTDKGSFTETFSYGYQKCFEVRFDSGQPVRIPYKNETYAYRLWNVLSYDLDTGILIVAPRFLGEGTLYTLGILQISSIMRIYDTNIDIGPSLIWPEVLDFAWFVLPSIGFFTVVFFAVYWRRRKRRRIVRRHER